MVAFNRIPGSQVSTNSTLVLGNGRMLPVANLVVEGDTVFVTNVAADIDVDVPALEFFIGDMVRVVNEEALVAA